MKNVIIGSGVVGKATGAYLEANNHEVYYNDINKNVLKDLEKKGKKTMHPLEWMSNKDIFWICTHEKAVESVISKYHNMFLNSIVVIRSTCPPGTIQYLQDKYKLKALAHNPEFLREKTALADKFNQDRIVIGTNNFIVKTTIEKIYKSEKIPVFFTDFTTSELIKYASNCWLSTQISYWNEVKKICDAFNVNPQAVANACSADKRISKYGTAMLGTPYGGMCFPKDMDAFINTFKNKKIKPTLLKAVKKVNDGLK